MDLKPIPFSKALLFFGIPTLIVTVGIYFCIPLLDKTGFPLFLNFFLFTGGPLILMFMASIVAYRIENNPMNWTALKDRFRLKPIQGKEWLWTLGLSVIYIGGYVVPKYNLLLRNG